MAPERRIKREGPGRQAGKQADKQTGTQADKQTSRKTEKETEADRQTSRQADKQTDRQTSKRRGGGMMSQEDKLDLKASHGGGVRRVRQLGAKENR